MNLFEKLFNRLNGIEPKEPTIKNNKKISKIATSLGLALTLGLTATFGAACGTTNTPPGPGPNDDPTKPPIVTPPRHRTRLLWHYQRYTK